MKTLKHPLKSILAVIVLLLFSFFQFEQVEQRFYYAYNEKIYISPVFGKLVVKYAASTTNERLLQTVRRVSLTAQIDFQGSDYAIIECRDDVEKDQVLKALRTDTDFGSVLPLFKVGEGLELAATDEFLVKFLDRASINSINEINQKYKVEKIKSDDVYTMFRVPKEFDVIEVANKYQESGLVLFSQPNFISWPVKHQQVIPNDAFFNNQFYLNNLGQVFTDGHFGTPDADIDAPEAWALTQGVNNITIAVIDDGVTPNHPDLPNLRQVILNGSNFANGDINNSSPQANNSHGNACAGIVSATHNNEGISGIAPNCRIMPIRIFNANCTGIGVNALADAITFARNNGAHVISNSWGFIGVGSDNPNLHPVIVTAIQQATTQGRIVNGIVRGCVVVFSAGNNFAENGPVHFPSNVTVPGVLTVGASDRNDLKAFYSPLGNPASPNNQLIDVVAPSHMAYPNQIQGETLEVWSIDIPGNTGYNPYPANVGFCQFTNPPNAGEQLPNAGINFQSYTGRFGGTSASCPQVSGVAALMLSANPNLTQQQVFNIITGTTDQVGGYVYTNGQSNEMGFGRLNACRALLQAYNTGNSIVGPGTICNTETYSLANTPNADRITWTSSNPNGLSINPTGVAIRENNFSGQVTITATINSGCGSVNVTRNVNVGNYHPIGTSSINSNCSGSTFNILNTSLSGACTANTPIYFTYRITDPNYSNFVFTPVSVPSGASWSSSGGNLYVTVYTPPSQGTRSATIALSATGPCGPYNVNFISTAVNYYSGGYYYSSFPNPASETLTIEQTYNTEENREVGTFLKEGSLDTHYFRLYDFNSSRVVLEGSVSRKTEIDVSKLAKGRYILKIQIANDKEETHQVIIN